jgi:hypothetical protein
MIAGQMKIDKCGGMLRRTMNWGQNRDLDRILSIGGAQLQLLGVTPGIKKLCGTIATIPQSHFRSARKNRTGGSFGPPHWRSTSDDLNPWRHSISPVRDVSLSENSLVQIWFRNITQLEGKSACGLVSEERTEEIAPKKM